MMIIDRERKELEFIWDGELSAGECQESTAVCIIQGMRLFILKKKKCLVNSISPSILHRMI